jgi:hypothetical protein
VDPRSVIELALVHRLASLLWRLRRATAIETGLFELQSELAPARRQDPSCARRQPGPTTRANGHGIGPGSNGRDDPPASDLETLSTSMRPPLAPWSNSRTIAQCFLRLSNLDPTLLDRVGSYEARLWRQAAQTIWTLEAMRQPPPPIRQRLRHRVAPFTWDREGKGRSRLTHSLGVERSDDDGCVRGGSPRKSVEARQVIRLSAPARLARQYDSPGLG